MLACVADVIKPRLITSTKQRRDPCSDPQRTQRITGSAFRISSHLDWEIDNALSWCALKSWYTGGGLEQGFWRCFAD